MGLEEILDWFNFIKYNTSLGIMQMKFRNLRINTFVHVKKDRKVCINGKALISRYQVRTLRIKAIESF